MKPTKIQQTKIGETTESPETKSKKRSKKTKLNSTEKFYVQKNSREIWKVIHRILNQTWAHALNTLTKRLKDLPEKMQQPMTSYYLT